MRRCLRDLIAFTSLPLLSKDKTPRQIADDLAAVLESTLGSEFVLVRITGPFAEAPIDAARAATRYADIDGCEISERVAAFLDLKCEQRPIAIPNQRRQCNSNPLPHLHLQPVCGDALL